MLPKLKSETPGPTRDIGTIEEDYDVLYGDQDPILFTGLNKYGGRIVGTFVDEDDHAKVTRTLQVQVTPRQYQEFLRGAITYLQLVKDAGAIYLVDQDFAHERQPIVWATSILDDVPREYLPLEHSYIPPVAAVSGPGYVHKLEGSRAAAHRARPAVVSVIIEAFSDVLAQSVQTLHDIRDWIYPELVAFKPASFEIHFSLSVADAPQLRLFPIAPGVNDFVRLYIDYCLNHISDEAPLLSEHTGTAEHFQSLLMMQGLITGSHPKSPKEKRESETELIRSLEKGTRSFADISAVVGADIKSITLFNEFAENVRRVVGHIDRESSREIDDALNLIESTNTTLTKDVSPRAYRLLMYALNRETRRGSAYIVGDDDHMPRTRISIADKVDLTNITEGFHLQRVLSVRGIATRNAANTITSLSVESLGR